MLYEILNLFFPSPCLSCGYLGRPLCRLCLQRLPFEPHVRRVDDLAVCAAMYYVENCILERLIHPFKYKHQAELFRIFVPPMREALKLLGSLDVVLVPVPLHAKRQRERG